MNHDETSLKIVNENGQKSLSLPLKISLEEVSGISELPVLFKQTLQQTPWQRRVEFSLARGISSTSLLPGWVAGLMAWGAEVTFRTGEDTLGLDTYLQHGEARHEGAASLRIPFEVSGRVWAGDQLARAPADQSIVSVTAVLDSSDDLIASARIALTGVWQRGAGLAGAAQQLEGKRLTADLIEETAQAIQDETAPRADFLGSVDYRRAMAGVLIRRVLHTCAGKGA